MFEIGARRRAARQSVTQPVEIGFQLLVRPNVVPGTRKMQMEVIPKETSLSGTSAGSALAPAGFDLFTVGAAGLEGSIALPRTRSSTLITNMTLESGQTAVLGGLSTDVDTETVTEVPGLSKIPLLGWLFQHEERSRSKNTLMVFVTPSVIRSSAETQRLLERELRHRHGEYGERMQQILFGDDPDYESGGHTAVMETETSMTDDPSDSQWATFVQQTADPEDQEVIDLVEGEASEETDDSEEELEILESKLLKAREKLDKNVGAIENELMRRKQNRD